jgi:Protein of unknown function (DUF1573)
MVRQLIIIAALLIVAIVIVSWVHAEYRGPGQLVFDDVYFDAGNIAQRGEVPHAFAFRNIGGKAVTITKVTTTCSCTTGRLTKRQYGPGQRGVIAVQMRIGAFGLNEQQVLVYTNQSAKPQALTIRALYQPAGVAIAVPSSLVIPVGDSHDPGRAKVEILTRSPMPDNAPLVKCSGRSMKIVSGPVARVRNQTYANGYLRTVYDFQVVPTASASFGDAANIVVTFPHSPRLGQLYIPVRFERVQGSWVPFPSKVFFVMSPSIGTAGPQTVSISGPAIGDTSVRSIENPMKDWLDVQIKPGTGSLDVTFSIKTRPPKDRIDGKVGIVLDVMGHNRPINVSIPVALRIIK